MNRSIIQAEDYVIIRKKDVYYLAQVQDKRPVFISKQKLNLINAVGQQFGTFFERSGNNINPVDPQKALSSTSVGDQEVAADADEKDNRAIVDDGKSQALTKDDIENLKAKGVSGQEIVENLVEHSSTFQLKTTYSQEKYVRKKGKKYETDCYQLLKPTARLLVIYYSQNPQKNNNLRMDSLAQMLCFCNVMSGIKCMVLDGVQGLLAGAVLERLGDRGCLVHIYPESAPTTTYRQGIAALDLPSEVLQDMVFSIPFEQAASVLKLKELPQFDETATVHNGDSAKAERKQQRLVMQMKAKESLVKHDMDCLLVSSKYDPAGAICLLDFLSNSRPFAIHCITQRPLVEIYVDLKHRGDVINMDITESFLRNYQVLPDRTRPVNNDSGTGGYLLTGIKVQREADA